MGSNKDGKNVSKPTVGTVNENYNTDMKLTWPWDKKEKLVPEDKGSTQPIPTPVSNSATKTKPIEIHVNPTIEPKPNSNNTEEKPPTPVSANNRPATSTSSVSNNSTQNNKTTDTPATTIKAVIPVEENVNTSTINMGVGSQKFIDIDVPSWDMICTMAIDAVSSFKESVEEATVEAIRGITTTGATSYRLPQFSLVNTGPIAEFMAEISLNTGKKIIDPVAEKITNTVKEKFGDDKSYGGEFISELFEVRDENSPSTQGSIDAAGIKGMINGLKATVKGGYNIVFNTNEVIDSIVTVTSDLDGTLKAVEDSFVETYTNGTPEEQAEYAGQLYFDIVTAALPMKKILEALSNATKSNKLTSIINNTLSKSDDIFKPNMETAMADGAGSLPKKDFSPIPESTSPLQTVESGKNGSGVNISGPEKTPEIGKVDSPEVKGDAGDGGTKGGGDSFKKYGPNEIEKKYGLNKGQFHREVKADILSDLTRKDSLYRDMMKKVGNNPDIYLASNGKIRVVSTQFKGKSFDTDLFIQDFLP